MKPRWKRSRMLSKKLIGAARMPPRCWASVTKRCFTRSASSDLIPGAQRVRAVRKLVEEELPVQGPHHPILRPQASMASGASTCNGMVIEGGEFSGIARNTIRSGEWNRNEKVTAARYKSGTSHFQRRIYY